MITTVCPHCKHLYGVSALQSDVAALAAQILPSVLREIAGPLDTVAARSVAIATAFSYAEAFILEVNHRSRQAEVLNGAQ